MIQVGDQQSDDFYAVYERDGCFQDFVLFNRRLN